MKTLFFAIILAAVLPSTLCHAQTASPTSQALSACIARSTTAEDNVTLVRWMFVAMARHPTVANLSNVPDAERVSANRQMGELVNRLILQSCREESRVALLTDGEAGFGAAFETFGKSAMEQIMGHPDVNAAIAEMASYFDQAGLVELIGRSPPERDPPT